MRRVVCIALPEVRVEIASTEAQRSEPLAVVVARPGGAVQTERDVLGNTRIDMVSRAARALGVRRGQTVAAARAKADLHVRVVAEGAVRGALERVAEVALGFGPAASFDVAQDVVWVEITGCAHLHGGERELAAAIVARVRALGHACRVAIAGGPRIAAAVARFARAPLTVIETCAGAKAMRALPVAALGLDDDVAAWLTDLGLRSCGDLQRLPRRSLGTRLGARAHDVMQLLDGEDRAPLDAWRPPEIPEERVELEWGIGSVEALAFVVKSLCDRLAARLEGRAMAAARLELLLGLDRGVYRAAGAAGEGTSALAIALPTPVARAADLLAVVRARLEHHALAAPVLRVTLRAPELARPVRRTLDLLSPEPKADRALPRLVGELAAELGPERVGTLALADTWIPDERTLLVPYGAPSPVAAHVPTTSALEPTRLVPPVRVVEEACSDIEPLARIEGVAWWRTGSRHTAERRDIVAAWMPRHAALAWVELRSAPHMETLTLRGWVD
jgi:protein ImuB